MLPRLADTNFLTDPSVILEILTKGLLPFLLATNFLCEDLARVMT